LAPLRQKPLAERAGLRAVDSKFDRGFGKSAAEESRRRQASRRDDEEANGDEARVAAV